ncbi:hypothetical protein [Idiomarina sp. 017G]|uniref:hypothetical protein n=1 Tax=Idiomarina sp. 017G TaxID=2183988 RepID=UPI000E0F4A71|nr:hypothetical protein [Idiomarina sp. 017G]
MTASVIGVVLTKVGLVPSKISAFGVEFTSSNQRALMIVLAAAIAYFAVSFMVYVYSELTAWKIVIASKEIEEIKEQSKNESYQIFGVDEDEKFRQHLREIYSRSKPTFYIRLGVELLIPIAFAGYSCFSLVNAEIPNDNSKPATVLEKPAINWNQQELSKGEVEK